MNKSSPIDTYFNRPSAPQKSMLIRVRKMISEILPESAKSISYGIPAFTHHGIVLGSFVGKKKHCSYSPFSRSTSNPLSHHLSEANWLNRLLSAGDLLMVSVLRRLKPSGLLNEFPNLAAYIARGKARPAFKQAYDAPWAVYNEDL